MENEHDAADQKTSRRVPWNKGKLIGAKPPLRPSHVWAIRTKLQVGDKFLSPILKSPTSASGRGRVKTRSRIEPASYAHTWTWLYARIVAMSGVTPNIEIMRFRL